MKDPLGPDDPDDAALGPITWPWDPPRPTPAAPAALPLPYGISVPLTPEIPPPPPPFDASLTGAPPPANASLADAPPIEPGMVAPSDAGQMPPMPPAAAPAAPGPLPLPYGISVPLTPPPAPAQPEAPLPDFRLPYGISVPRQLTPEQERENAYQATARNYVEHPDQLLDRMGQPGALDTDTQRFLNELAVVAPQDFAELNLRFGAAKASRLAAEQARINEADWQTQKANIAMRNKAIADAQAQTAKLDADAQQLANTKVGPHLSTFQRVAGTLMGVIGGLYQGRVGGRNIGLDALNDVINRDLENQRTEMANQRESLVTRRNALAEQYARSGDMYQAAEVMRLAALKHADDQLATMQQNFAPDGTRGLQIAQLRAGIAGQQSQVLHAYAKERLDYGLKLQNAAREQQQADEAGRHDRAQEGIDYGRLAIDRLKAAQEGQLLTPDQLRAIMTVPGQPPPPVPPVPMTLKNYRAEYLPAVKTGQEAGLGGREYSVGDVRPVRDADGNIVGTESKPLVNADGKLFQAPSTDEAKQLRTQVGGVNATNQLIDQMVSGIEKYGGSSKFFKSAEWQAMQANKESLLFALHQAYGVTGFRPGVLEQMEHALGGQDPTAYAKVQENAIPGLRTAKRDLNTHLNANLRAAGYTGEEYSPPDLTPPAELPRLGDRTLAESGPGALDKLGAGLKEDAKALVSDPTELGPNAGAAPDNGPPVGPTGLSVRDTQAVEDLVRRYKTGTPATRERVVTALSAPMGADRPSLNTGILGLVAGEAPELYNELLKALPPDQREAELRNQATLRALQPQLNGGQ